MPEILAKAPDTREWLEADGLGGFASGPVSGPRTRRYHALLLAASLPPSGRMVLVSGFQAQLETSRGERIPFVQQRYTPGVNSPDPVAPLREFSLDPWPQWTFALPGGKLIQEIFVPRGRAAVVLRWRWQGSGKMSLRLRPLFAGRDFHSLHQENAAFRFAPQEDGDNQRWQFYDGIPAVAAQSNAIYQHEPYWYRHFLYSEEEARGMDAVEDLAVPGLFLFNLDAAPAVLIFSAPDLGTPLPAGDAVTVANQLDREERARRGAFTSPRLSSAESYLVSRGEGRTIIAGYPWFGDWGRDTFISMRGFFLATGRLRDARDILLAWADAVSQGMLPNRFPDHGEAPEYNSVDASLWYIIVVHEFLSLAAGDAELSTGSDRLLAAVAAILSGYQAGTRYGIHADRDGLLACGEPGVQLTWMDAKVGDWVVTPRIGKPVEVQALWLNALALAGAREPKWQALFEQGRETFRRRFWNDTLDCLFDVIDADHEPGKTDPKVRPNQIFAVGGLPLSLLDDRQARRVVQVVEEKLWTPLGPRSLSPDDPEYTAHYAGDVRHRDAGYHQGTVWPWLTGAFVEAWVRVQDNPALAKKAARERFLTPQLLRLDLAGLRHLPEIADGAAPHTARGCPFQAWSLAEILRLELQVLG
jgi:predicted glycogen debranching enzyme